MLSGTSSLPINISAAPEVLKNYNISLKNKKFEEAKKATSELVQLMSKHIDTTAEDVRIFGEKLRDDKCFVESIMMFDASSILSEKINKPEEKLEKIEVCVYEMKRSNAAMISDDVDMKVIVKGYVIPLMHDKLRKMERTSSVSEQHKCLQMTWVLHHIEFCHKLVDQLKECERTQKEGIQRMNQVFGQDKIKHRVYGHLLNNLGTLCHSTSRYDEAVSFYRQSIVARKAATDYRDEEARKKDITRCEENLRNAQEKTK